MIYAHFLSWIIAVIVISTIKTNGQTIGFSLRGQSYPNHGLVLREDIGETDNEDLDPNNGLHCISDVQMCCSAGYFRGEFDFPDGTQVPTLVLSSGGYYRNRDPDRIFLNRPASVTTPQGLFRCRIVTSQTSAVSPAQLYIGVYEANSGSSSITSLEYDATTRTLTCVTTGGPATTITWRRNCVSIDLNTSPGVNFTQTVTDQAAATYMNVLTLPSPVEDGSYSCTVTNARGSDTAMVQVGSPPIVVTVTSSSPVLGSSHTLTCSFTGAMGSPTVQWRNGTSGMLLTTGGDVTMTDTTPYQLTFSQLTQSHLGDYYCEVKDGGDEGCFIERVTQSVNMVVAGGTATAGASHNLMCTVSGVDLSVLGTTATYTWRRGSSVLSSTKNQYIIASVGVSDAGDDYQCTVAVTASYLDITGFLSASGTSSLYVQLQTPTITVTSNPTGIITVGSFVTLTCTVELSPSVDVPVTVNTVWTGPDNFNRNIMAQQIRSTTTYTSTVMVSSFGRDQSGNYTCTATVSSPAQFIVTSIPESSSVKITSFPRPTVYLISSSTNPVVSGSLITLTCTVEFHQPVGVPLTINTVWTGPVGSAITGATYPAVMESLTLYQSSVTTKLNFSGKYTCTANVSGAFEVSASTSIEIVDEMFQLRLKGTDICSQWYNENSNKSGQYSRFIKEAVTEAVARRCKCQFLVSNLLEDSFSCEESTNFLTYRSTLRGTYNFNGSQITDFIQDWVSSGPRIKIGYYREYVRIDSSCPAAISSLDEPDCGHNTNNGNSGCQTYGNNPGSFTQCAQELENDGIARCIEGCVVRNG